jgi:hypothetical protein
MISITDTKFPGTGPPVHPSLNRRKRCRPYILFQGSDLYYQENLSPLLHNYYYKQLVCRKWEKLQNTERKSSGQRACRAKYGMTKAFDSKHYGTDTV